jgi:hypothetical protein
MPSSQWQCCAGGLRMVSFTQTEVKMNKTILIGRINSMTRKDNGNLLLVMVRAVVDENGETSTQSSNVLLTGKSADACEQNLHDGDLCCIEGDLKDGYLYATKVVFLSKKQDA